MTKASVCTIGDEILIGQIVDTNSSHISRALNSLGIRVGKMVSIADDAAQIKDCLEAELRENDIVVCTGGLAPQRTTSQRKPWPGCPEPKAGWRIRNRKKSSYAYCHPEAFRSLT